LPALKCNTPNEISNSPKVFSITPKVLPDTFPANRHSPTGCRLDTSLLSTGQQGAERHAASKVMERASVCLSESMITKAKD